MSYSKAKTASAFLTLLLLTQTLLFGQGTARDKVPAQQIDKPVRTEVPDSEAQRRFVWEHSFANPLFRQQQIEIAPVSPEVVNQVRMIYLMPSDKSPRADYQNAMANAISDLQRFYRNQLGGVGFTLHAPIVEVYQLPHPAAFYSTADNARPGGFYEGVLADGFALTGGGFNDPNNRWIYYADADNICGQYTGGTQGIALLPGNDLRGLTSQTTVPTCPGDHPSLLSVNRWIGGLGHELGHSFNLPHPPGCDNGNCDGGSFAFNSLMYIGYSIYPNTYLLAADKTQLLTSPLTQDFFSVQAFKISGQVRWNNSGLGGVTVTLSGSMNASATTDAGGNYSFSNLTAGQQFTISSARANYTFSPPNFSVNDLEIDQVVNFTATINPGVPILLSEASSTRALAFDSVLWTREPFQPSYELLWGDDHRTRIVLLATNFDLTANEGAEAVTAEAEDSAHQTYPLHVEFVGKVPDYNWLNRIVVRLDQIGDVGDVLVRINYHNIVSNRVRVGIGHVGGGLPDDPGSSPTPGRAPF
jgi:hypothetical protein